MMEKLDCSTNKIKITVGETVLLTCSGNINSSFSLERASFKQTESDKYSIKLLKVISVNENETHLDVTYYVPGEHKITNLILTDGVGEINLNGTSVFVESVIKQAPDGKPPESFGPILPIKILVPMHYYLFMVFIFLLIGIYTIFKIRRISYYKKLKNKLTQFNSPVTPEAQFYKSIRHAEKENFPIDQVEKAFRLYNLRTYQLPMFDLPNHLIIKYFKYNRPQGTKTRMSLAKLLDEFEELKKRNNLTFTEKNELIKKLYRYVEVNTGIEL